MPMQLIEPSMVVVNRYSNTPYIPWGTTHSLYLDVGTFPGGVTSTQLPLDRPSLCWLLLLAGLRCFYHVKWGKWGWRHTPISQSSYWMVWRRNTIFPIPSPCQFPCWLLLHNWRGTQTEGGSDCCHASTQMEGGQATTHPSNSYRTTTRPEFNWNISSSRRHRIWPKGTSLSEPNRPRGIQGNRHSC